MIRWPYNWRKKEACPALIPHIGGMIYRWDCFVENMFIRFTPLPKNGINDKPRDEYVIVSITTFPARIKQCYFSIKSLMLQDYKADRIVLWLAEDQFPEHRLPEEFQELIDRGLTIRYCEDYRSHKKYYYALQEQKPGEVVITFDDDIIYETDAISKVVKMHHKYPECIICNRGYQIVIVDNTIQSYNKWRLCTPVGVDNPVYNIMPSTGAGCLYPYGIMPKETFNIEEAKRIAWTADDLWMRFNSLAKGVKVVKTKEKIATLCNVAGSQAEALTVINNVQGENDRVIERLVEKFPHVIVEYLRED